MEKAQLSRMVPAAEPIRSATAMTVKRTATCSGLAKSARTDCRAGLVLQPSAKTSIPVYTWY